MSTYVITGGTTGIGAATRKLLLSQGHEVFNIDFKGGDYLADLSAPQGRQGAIDEVFRRYPDGIDVLICNAGVGPTAPPQMIFALNFFASVKIAEALRPLLKKKKGNCVVTSSNSITNMTVRMDWVDMLSTVPRPHPVTAPPSMPWRGGSAGFHRHGQWTDCVLIPWLPATPLRP